MISKILEVKNLIKEYKNIRAVDDISFDVFEGDVFGFLGPNGAGKSTTLRCIVSLIKQTSGEIKIFGKDPIKERREIFSNIGCMIERPDFYKYLTAAKNLELLARASQKNVSKKRISEVLEFVGLNGREGDKISSYSNGMKQRLGIAQTLLHDPVLIILDEPTSGLDPQGIIDIRNLILRMKTEYKQTIILSSHLLSEIELIANRLIIINKGKLLVEGYVKEVLNNQELNVRFTVDNIEKAMQIATGFVNNNAKQIGSHSVVLHISESQTANFNKLLCDSGINVFSIESKRKLEDYFLNLVNN